MARLGGDEFCVILINLNFEQTKMLVDRIVTALKNDESISVAVGFARRQTIIDLCHTMKEANYNMYYNKKLPRKYKLRSILLSSICRVGSLIDLDLLCYKVLIIQRYSCYLVLN